MSDVSQPADASEGFSMTAEHKFAIKGHTLGNPSEVVTVEIAANGGGVVTMLKTGGREGWYAVVSAKHLIKLLRYLELDES